MRDLESKVVESTLKESNIHQEWIKNYRTIENNVFYSNVFKYLKKVLHAPDDSTFLDAGCGTGAHSIRLAELGFKVIGIDISNAVLDAAKQNIAAKDLQDRIKLQQESLLHLSFPDNSFNYIICWGVLMHIPEIEKAISELDRVLKKGGVIVISENNMYSFQSFLIKNLKRILGKKKTSFESTISGNEYWRESSSGKLFIRSLRPQWLKNEFIIKGYTVKKHISGQFSELYIKIPSPFLKKILHLFNGIWFKYVRIPFLSSANLFIFEKNK